MPHFLSKPALDRMTKIYPGCIANIYLPVKALLSNGLYSAIFYKLNFYMSYKSGLNIVKSAVAFKLDLTLPTVNVNVNDVSTNAD